MTTRVTLHSLPDGQVVVEKQAIIESPQETGAQGKDTQGIDTDAVTRRHEAEWLAMARHSGVVQLIGVGEEPFTIRTAHAGTTTLRTALPDPLSAARMLGATAQTLADLHERDLVHGNLTLDHVIVSGENRTTLCSPDGSIDDPTVDLVALGQMMTELLEQWRANTVKPENESEWLSLAERLKSEDSNLTARRAHLAFGRLGAKPESTANNRPNLSVARGLLAARKPSTRTIGTVLTLVAVVGVLVSWLTILNSPTPNSAQTVGVELLVRGNLFRVGHDGDVVLAVPSRCEGQPEAVLLDAQSVVWIFDQATDQSSGVALAQIPGATNLIGEIAEGCGHIWATGPAGQTLVVGRD